MIWRVMLYIVATESNENNMLEKKKEKQFASPIKKALSLIWIFLRPKPAVKNIQQMPELVKRARLAQP